MRPESAARCAEVTGQRGTVASPAGPILQLTLEPAAGHLTRTRTGKHSTRADPSLVPFESRERSRSTPLEGRGRNPPLWAYSLVGLWRFAFEAVDKTGLGRAEREPIVPGLLQCNEELPTTVHCLFMEFVLALELDLERELAAHRTVRAALVPNGDVRLGRARLPKSSTPRSCSTSSTMVWFTNSTLSVSDAFRVSTTGRIRARAVIDERSSTDSRAAISQVGTLCGLPLFNYRL